MADIAWLSTEESSYPHRLSTTAGCHSVAICYEWPLLAAGAGLLAAGVLAIDVYCVHMVNTTTI